MIESLVAIVIVSMVAVAAYAGLRTSLRSSVQHRESATAETLLRSAAERLQDPTSTYLPLAGCSGPSYVPIATSEYSSDIDPSAYPIAVDVRFWAPSASAAPPYETTFLPAGECPPADPGLQQVVLSISTPSGFTETLTVVKRSA